MPFYTYRRGSPFEFDGTASVLSLAGIVSNDKTPCTTLAILLFIWEKYTWVSASCNKMLDTISRSSKGAHQKIAQRSIY